MMEFYGCMFCDKAVDCQIAGEPAADCPVEALIKAKEDFKESIMESIMKSKGFKVMEWILDRLEALIGIFT